MAAIFVGPQLTLAETVFVDIAPDTLNLMSTGNWVTCYIEAPAGCTPEGINIHSVAIKKLRVNGGVPIAANIPADLSPTEITEYNRDRIPERMVKFSRPALQESIASPGPNLLWYLTRTHRFKVTIYSEGAHPCASYVSERE